MGLGNTQGSLNMTSNRKNFPPIAIVGMACRLPGASNLDEFWDLIVSGGDATAELPPDVLDRDLYYDPRRGMRNKTYSTAGGLAPRIPFDNSRCKIDPEFLPNCDPAHLNACEVAYDAICDAGYDPHNMPSVRSGVYFGHTGGSPKAGDIAYSSYIEETTRFLHNLDSLKGLKAEEIDAIAGKMTREVRERCDHRAETPYYVCSPINAPQVIASVFGLDGPCVVVDAACASSLQALALGVRALQLGETEMVIAGGASYCKSDSLVLFSAAQSVSSDKSCPFDDGASGLITAEGYVVFALKTLSQAIADGDRVRCVIKGIGMSADGRGKSLWAPRKEGQAIAMQRAYPEPYQPEDVQYIEAHATSTQVGDATELSALADAFPESLADGRKIPLGSVKGNIGHTLETAGVAGLCKTVLAIEHETIPPVANLKTPNSTVPWDKMPFYLPTEPQPWKRTGDGSGRKAAVNSFGIGGLNIHVFLEEFIDGQSARAAKPTPIPADSKTKEPVAVIGTGAILPGAKNMDEFWQLLSTGSSAICEVPKTRWDASKWVAKGKNTPFRTPHSIGGFITDYAYDWRRHRVPPKQVANANPLQFMLLDATEQALEQAGLLKNKFDRDRVGVVVGTIFGGDFSNELQAGLRLPEFGRSLRQHLNAHGFSTKQIDDAIAEYEKTLLARMPALHDETGSFTSSTLASRITKTFDLKGGALALDAGEGAGLAAMGACIDVLRTGECDMMICATGQRNMDFFAFESLCGLGLLTEHAGPHAFAADNSGFVPGEGCAVLLLKRLSDAQRDGDNVLAVLHGVGASFDREDAGKTGAQAMQRALKLAGRQPTDINYLEVSGKYEEVTRAEVESLNQLVENTGSTSPVHLNAVISQIGYLGAAHSVVGVLKAISSITHGKVPVGDVCDTPNPHLPFTKATQPQKNELKLPEHERPAIGVTCGAGSGPAFCAVVEPVHDEAASQRAPAQAKSTPSKPHIVRIGAKDQLALNERLQNSPIGKLFQPEVEFSKADRARLAVVCTDATDFAEKLSGAMRHFDKPVRMARKRMASNGTYRGQVDEESRGLAFVFPGQGSQYAGMLSTLIDELPEAALAARRANASMEALGYESFEEIAGPDSQDLGTDIWKTQVSMLLADCIFDCTFRELGLEPKIVAGHSFGEYPALVSAGAMCLTDAIRAARHRCLSIEEHARDTGCMAALSVGAEDAQRILASVGGDVFAANFNAPDQTVIAGHRKAVDAAMERFKQEGFSGVIIKVPCPFHTPLMLPTAMGFEKRVADVPIRDARIPVVSTASAACILSAADIRESIVQQLTRPVKWGEVLQRVLATNPALVVEVGPRQTLTQLNKKNSDSEEVVFMSSDIAGRSGLASAMGVVAQAECLGCLAAGSTTTESTTSSESRREGRVLFADATVRRTTAMKERSRGKKQVSVAVGSGGHGDVKNPASLSAAERTDSNGSKKPTKEVAPAPSAAQETAESPEPAGAVNRISDRDTKAPAATQAVKQQPAATDVNVDELRETLIGFVVDQTGYPEDIIEFDIDLEADLGIDSIKKAQLFGEVGERFQIAPREDLSLDDFPTLDHVLEFLVEELGARTAEPSPPEESTDHTSEEEQPAQVETDGPEVDELREILIGFVVDQTGYPEDIIEFDIDLEADLGIDSIKKAQLFGEVGERFQIAPREDLSLDDFPTLNHVLEFLVDELGTRTPDISREDFEKDLGPATDAPSEASSAEEPDAASAGPSVDELREILIGFVVDQTGYPEDIIEFDIDLEADLGIDSIKKAQLFGEVGERFQIAPRDDLSLDDFPTLDHVLEFLLEELGSRGDSPSAIVEAQESMQEVPTESEPDVPTKTETPTPTFDIVQLQVMSGDPSADGRMLGQLLKQAIQWELRNFVNGGPHTNGSPPPQWPAPWCDELLAMAEAARVNKESVFALNRLAEPLAALPASFNNAAKRNSQPQRPSPALISVRKPLQGLPYLTLGLPGRLVVPAGINSMRIAISCEPLDTVMPPEDAIKVGRWLHTELSRSQSMQDVADSVASMELKGCWSIGASEPRTNTTSYWVFDSGRMSLTNAGATKEQIAFHHAIESDPDTVSLFERGSDKSSEFNLSDLLPSNSQSAKEAPHASTEKKIDCVMKRYVMRMTEADRLESGVPHIGGGSSVCLIGDGELRDTIREGLTRLGCEVTTVARRDLQSAFESTEADEVPTNLILLADSDSQTQKLDDFDAAEHFNSVFHACKRWIATLEAQELLSEASLVAITRMGGDFAFHSSAAAFSGGGATGLLKAIRREFPAVRVKALDFDIEESADVICDETVNEVNAASSELEVGFRGGKRFIVKAEQLDLDSENRGLSHGGVWVVSGGGRGVTFAVARELASRYGAKLHLLGTAPLPKDAPWRGMTEEQLRDLRRDMAIQSRRESRNPADDWRRVEKAIELDKNLKQLAAAGLAATYHSVDVADRAGLSETLASIREKDGPINGVLHGAGVEASCRFTRKNDGVVRATIASKCNGAANLIALTRTDPLEYFAAFGSTSGRFGGLGQADYSLASDLLAKMVSRLGVERTDVKAMTFHWPAWGGVGMAVRPESRVALERGGIAFMPVEEGIEHFMDELAGATGEREILFIEKPDVLDTDDTMTRETASCGHSVFIDEVSRGQKSGRGVSDVTAVSPAIESKHAAIDCSRMPMIEAIRREGDSMVADVSLDPENDPFLVHHTFRGKPFLPGVATMEMFAEAASLIRPTELFGGMSDLKLTKGLSLTPPTKQSVQIVMENSDQGVYCELRTPTTHSNGKTGKQNQAYASAWVEFGSKLPEIEPIDPGKPIFAWTPFIYPEHVAIKHGAPLQTFKQLDFIHGGGRAMLICGQWRDLFGNRQGDPALVASATLDGCMVACGTFSFFMVHQTVELPKGIEAFRQVRLPRPSEHCIMRFYLRDLKDDGNTYDFALVGDQGDLIFEVEGYQSFQPLESK